MVIRVLKSVITKVKNDHEKKIKSRDRKGCAVFSKSATEILEKVILIESAKVRRAIKKS